jgi:CheY-like chemotaxis protein
LLREGRSGQWRRSEGPVILLTARSDEVDRIVGLELGADDCVGKPLQDQRQDWTELLAQGTGSHGLVIAKTMSPTKRLNDSFSTNCL